MDIRESNVQDLALIESLYPQAFPDEDLLPVVRELLDEKAEVLSLVGIAGTDLVGHIAFSTCTIPDCTARCSLLAPLAIAPDWQQRGMGSKLVYSGLKSLREAGINHIFVLGDPKYYSRFGFETESRVTPPYRLPDEWLNAWQSICLGSNDELPSATLSVPAPWQKKVLWVP